MKDCQNFCQRCEDCQDFMIRMDRVRESFRTGTVDVRHSPVRH